MHCSRCGAPLDAGALVCGSCGHQTAPVEAHSTRTTSGVPVGRYRPSSYGPPVHPDVAPRGSVMEPEAPSRRAFGYRPVVLPPPPPERAFSARRALLRLVLLLLVVVVIGGTAAYATGRLPLHAPHAGPALDHGAPPAGGPHAVETAPALSQPDCPAVSVDPTAAQALTHVQLTTGLRDAPAHDYRPINTVTTFSAGQTGYVTFQVATARSGIAAVVFCLPGERVTGSLGVLAGSAGRYGEFSARLDASDVGAGRATLTWNGAVAADIPFTITR